MVTPPNFYRYLQIKCFNFLSLPSFMIPSAKINHKKLKKSIIDKRLFLDDVHTSKYY